ncbi:hypothetical protein DF152_17215 [Burkholderia cenocepacia]|nr:hypothetical protein DF152_17215 [Burkholderia cenocepacia]
MRALKRLAAVTRRLFLVRKLRATEARADRLEAHARQCRAQARAYWGEAQLAGRAGRDLSNLARDAYSQVGDEHHETIADYRRKAGEELHAAGIYDEMAGERSADAYESEKWAAEAREQAAAIRRKLSA